MSSSLDELPAHVRLEARATARDKAVAASDISPGSVILEVPSMVVLLLSSGKGRRCDFCLCSGTSEIRLARCTGCASYWYCGSQCAYPLSMTCSNSLENVSRPNLALGIAQKVLQETCFLYSISRFSMSGSARTTRCFASYPSHS
jgi:hypothetical protein